MKRFKCRVCCPIIAVWGIVHTHTHKRAVRIDLSKNIVHFCLKTFISNDGLLFLLLSGTEECKSDECVTVGNTHTHTHIHKRAVRIDLSINIVHFCLKKVYQQ